MLVFSRLLAEIGRKIKLPIVLGELIVGIILGPTIFGQIAPKLFLETFPETGAVPISLNALTNIAVVLLLFVAGLEVQLPMVLRQGKVAILTGLGSLLVPFVMGFGVAWFLPNYLGFTQYNHHFLFALFFGTAMSISALPVITRILMDLNLFKTNIGMIVIACAMFNDLIGWLIFSVILAELNKHQQTMAIGYTISLIMGFGLFMLTVGKRLIDKSLPWIQKELSWPGGVLSILLGSCFLAAAFTEYIGLHAILGAFIMGIAFGDSVHLHEKAREIIHQFVTNIFAPLFFVSIGLKVNFIDHFDLQIVSIVVFIAYSCKLLGSYIGARIGGMSKNHSLAIGFGLSARGAMEIILGTLALNAHLINEKIFVALVIMALLTSITSGPLMRKFVDR